ncbi:MAG: thiol peroxidase [bacterium]|nr:thiol peroxidase [bacterium]
MEERKGVVTARGKPLTLLGPDLKVGDKAPDFKALSCVTLIDQEPREVSLRQDFAGKICLISATPSLDTPVCDLQVRRLNQEAVTFPKNLVTIINISMDLPFAAKRFCTTAGIENVEVLSDHRDASFGLAYGVLIKELRLLARSIFVIDSNGIIRHKEIVADTTKHPDYERALEAVRGLL